MEGFEQRLISLLEMYLLDQRELLKELIEAVRELRNTSIEVNIPDIQNEIKELAGEVRELRYVVEEAIGFWRPNIKGGE